MQSPHKQTRWRIWTQDLLVVCHCAALFRLHISILKVYHKEGRATIKWRSTCELWCLDTCTQVFERTVNQWLNTKYAWPFPCESFTVCMSLCVRGGVGELLTGNTPDKTWDPRPGWGSAWGQCHQSVHPLPPVHPRNCKARRPQDWLCASVGSWQATCRNRNKNKTNTPLNNFH